MCPYPTQRGRGNDVLGAVIDDQGSTRGVCLWGQERGRWWWRWCLGIRWGPVVMAVGTTNSPRKFGGIGLCFWRNLDYRSRCILQCLVTGRAFGKDEGGGVRGFDEGELEF